VKHYFFKANSPSSNLYSTLPSLTAAFLCLVFFAVSNSVAEPLVKAFFTRDYVKSGVFSAPGKRGDIFAKSSQSNTLAQPERAQLLRTSYKPNAKASATSIKASSVRKLAQGQNEWDVTPLLIKHTP
jgi:hypothetical protein